MTELEKQLVGNFNAQDWASEFMRIFGNKKDSIDEGLMICWFANAIMTGYDYARRNEVKS